MANYKVLVGHDQALVDLDDMVPQPRNGVVQVNREYGVAGLVDGTLFVPLEWSVPPNGAVYQALLTQFGVLDTLYAAVTIQVKDDLLDLKRYNGIARQPRIGEDGGWRRFFARGFVIIVNNLELLA